MVTINGLSSLLFQNIPLPFLSQSILKFLYRISAYQILHEPNPKIIATEDCTGIVTCLPQIVQRRLIFSQSYLLHGKGIKDGTETFAELLMIQMSVYGICTLILMFFSVFRNSLITRIVRKCNSNNDLTKYWVLNLLEYQIYNICLTFSSFSFIVMHLYCLNQF